MMTFYAFAAGCCIAWRRGLLSPEYAERKGLRSQIAIVRAEARPREADEKRLGEAQRKIEDDRRRLQLAITDFDDKATATYEAERRRLEGEVMKLKGMEGIAGAFIARDMKDWEMEARAMKPADLQKRVQGLAASPAAAGNRLLVCKWVLISSLPALARADAKRQDMRARLDEVSAREAQTAAGLQETRASRQQLELEEAKLKVRLEELTRSIPERKVVLG
jgi:hypothetical protein